MFLRAKHGEGKVGGLPLRCPGHGAGAPLHLIKDTGADCVCYNIEETQPLCRVAVAVSPGKGGFSSQIDFSVFFSGVMVY